MSSDFSLIKDRKIRIAVVGCGKISTSHFAALSALKDQFEVSAVCDSHAETLKKKADELNVPGYADLRKMLTSDARPDAVVLCSPSGKHAEQAVLAAAHQVHVISEKPMATRWSDGLEMIKACDKAGVRLYVVKQNRHQPALQLIKKAISAGRFGRIYLVALNVFWTRPQQYYDQAKWRGTWEFDGGAFMNQASHYVDLLDWMIGPVQSVQAMMSTLGRDIEAEDTGIVNIRWRSGALGSMSFTMLTYPKNLEASLTILGEKGSVKAGGLSADKIEHWHFDADHELDTEAARLKDAQVGLTTAAGHQIYYENVARSLRGEAEPDVDGRSGLRSLEILVASYLSARDNRTVNLPLIL